MSRVEKLGVQGRLDLGEVRDADGRNGNKAARVMSGDSDSEASSSDEDDEGSEEGDGEGKGANTKEEREKKRLRGRNKALKRYLRKQRKNVIDPKAVRCF